MRTINEKTYLLKKILNPFTMRKLKFDKEVTVERSYMVLKVSPFHD